MSHITKARVNLRILSNAEGGRITWAKCHMPISREGMLLETAQRIIEAQIFAEENSSRAVTHNKGILNGIDAVALATGQDWRAIESGAHAFASKGTYKLLSMWSIEEDVLKGEITIPLAVGIVGGIIQFHPVVETALKIAGVKTSQDLARIMAAVGLAQNFAALYSLTGEGILKGHGALHRRKKNP